ncbi:hypothetical protein HOLleu_00236 [Holothuria leucospilota]|uniref:Sulfotransferase family protein n=1 Tax=Holothuria leucospilota TaxID=206669 RepID=A0A9Q1CNN8_HOLLE|nr:hypothetical protein HOLleu_00236 [Holothuria leucospilota]
MAANGTSSTPNRVFMWINPRSLSTSFEKCVGFMDGAQIWHEPYTTCYFNLLFNDPETKKLFPGMELFAKKFYEAQKLIDAGGHLYQGGNLTSSKKFNYDWVKAQLENPLEDGKKFMFMKDAAFSIDGHYDKLPEQVDVKHTFIIRHPNRVALSVRRLLSQLVGFEGKVEDFDIGSGHPFMAWEKLSPDPMYKLWNYVRENIDPNPIVIDADDLQTDPEQILRKYCEAVGIPFKKKYLKWEKSDESLKYFYGALDQMVWGKNEGCYDAAFLSSSFQPLSGPVPATIPDNCVAYAEEFREGYKVMYETRIKLD